MLQHSLNMCMSKVTLAAGTTTTISNTGTTTFSIKGRAYTKAAMTNAATPTTDVNTGAAFLPLRIPTSTQPAEGCVFVVGFDASGAVKVAQGPRIPAAEAAAGINAYMFPTLPDTVAPVGYVLVYGSATQVATWTFGTNNLSSVTGITYSFADLNFVPSLGITA